MTKNILINTRCLRSPTTGVQRYTKEIINHLPEAETIAPQKNSSGMYGHLWEQIVLPMAAKQHLLWSPANTGPLSVKHQVISILDLSTIDHPEWFSCKFSAWYGFLLPKLAHNSKHILTISEFSKSRIIERLGVSSEKITVTHLATDQRFQPQHQETIKKTKKEFNLPEYYFLALSSLEPRKNLERLIRIWGDIETKIPQDIWLVVSGAKGKESVFKELSFNTLPERILFTGYMPDQTLPNLYAGAIGFIYLSIYEGFGLPPLEAMASGTPVITSNTSSLPEVVGDAALLVNPLDTEEIANSIQSLINDTNLHDKLCVKGLQRAKLFSWEQTAAITKRVLQKEAEQA